MLVELVHALGFVDKYSDVLEGCHELFYTIDMSNYMLDSSI